MSSHYQSSVLPHAHADLVTDAAYDYYGLRLATCGLDQKIKIWRLDETTNNWAAEDEWKAHDAPIVKLSWAHPEFGTVLASCSFDRTVKVWEERRNEPRATAGAPTSRWSLRANLTEARGSVRSVEFGPPAFGLKLATISTDMHFRMYECLEVHNLTNWSNSETVDMSNVPSPSLVSQNTPTLISTGLDGGPSPSLIASQLNPPPTMPGGGLGPMAINSTRPGTGAREADGGWCLSWCKEKWWGELVAIGCGTSGVLKIIEFPSAQQPRTHLTLKQDPPPDPKSPSTPIKPYPITSVSWAPSCGRSYHLVATASRDTLVRVWKITPPKVPGASGEEGKWNAVLAAQFADHKASVARVEWNITGTILSSAGDDGKVRLYKQAYKGEWSSIGAFSTEHVEDNEEGMAE